MRIEGQSSNVEDRRGFGRTGLVGGGIGTLVLVVVGLFFGIDPRVLLGVADTVQSVQEARAPQQKGKAPTDPAGQFVSGVLLDTEKTWGALFQQLGRKYVDPKLVIFHQGTRTACGAGQAAVGPFYCPLDQTVYLDLDFLNALQQKFGAQGDSARAYVIAHEVGHHVQNQLGIMEKVQAIRERAGTAQANQLSVRLELQADCLAGVWAHHANDRKLFDAGDIEQAMRAAAAVGDDNIQRQTQGRIAPDSFTHGSSEQRTRWFTTGMKSGQITACNTFEGA